MARSIVNTPFDRVSFDDFKVDTYVISDVPARYVDGYVLIEGGGCFSTKRVDGTGKFYINGELVHDPATPSPTPRE